MIIDYYIKQIIYMSSAVNILFYSQFCQTCRNLINILQNEKLLGYFKLYCVDDKINSLPPFIEYVPTMLVADNSNKQLKLVKEETFEWVKKVKFIRQQNMMDMTKKIIQHNMLMQSHQNKNEPIGFVESEMNKISDGFAYKNIDLPMAQNFVNINNESTQVIYTPPQQKGDTINKQAQDKLMSLLENQRKEGETQFSEIMKQERLKAILEAERSNITNF